MTRKRILGRIYQLIVRSHNFWGSLLYIHLENEKPIGLEYNALEVRNSRIQTIYYTQRIMKRLPTPYKTDCLDYSKLGYKSRKYCIDKCLIESSVKKFNCLPNVNLSPFDPLYGSKCL
jgi:hypothetical protein